MLEKKRKINKKIKKGKEIGGKASKTIFS